MVERIEEEKFTSLILEHLDEGVILTNSQAEILYVNEHFCRTTGWGRDEVRGKNPRILSSGVHDKEFYRQMWEKILHNGKWEGEIWNRRKNGELYLEGAKIRKISDEKGETRFFLAVFQDITEKKRLEGKIRHLTYYDPVTDLPNEIFITETFQELTKKMEPGKGLAVVHFTFLHLGEIVNVMGNSFGNRLLNAVAEQLKGLVGQEGILGRWHGSQFLLLYPAAEREEVRLMIEKIIGEFQRHFRLDQQDFYLTLRAGVSWYPEDGEKAEILFRKAEEAAYCSREQSSPYLFYHPLFEEKIRTRAAIRKYLRESIEEKQLFLLYQPLIDLRNGKCIGVEALVRWNHPVLGLLSPGAFIPIAEEIGFVGLINEEVMRIASLQMKDWEGVAPSDFRISVNFSAQEFHQRDLVAVVDQILKESGIPGERIDIEITESALMQDTDQSIGKIYALKDRGIQISIDDFGTGYSSLQYLRRLPVDRLKIDRSFIETIVKDKRDQAIVKSVIEMGHNLGVKVLAEGIETSDQLHLIRDLQCDEGQGYLFSPPISAEELIGGWLHSRL